MSTAPDVVVSIVKKDFASQAGTTNTTGATAGAAAAVVAERKENAEQAQRAQAQRLEDPSTALTLEKILATTMHLYFRGHEHAPAELFDTVHGYVEAQTKQKGPKIDATRTLPRLPEETRQLRIQAIRHEIAVRNQKFLGDAQFKTWSMDRPENEIIGEYEQLSKWRQSVWYVNPYASTVESRTEFMIAQALLNGHRFRKPHLIAFDYNNTDSTYNSSTVILNDLVFLALEGPSETSIEAFRTLLHNHKAETVVCLTAAYEITPEKGKIDKCYPYWLEQTYSNEKGKFLRIFLETERATDPTYDVRFVATADWKDNAGGNPKQLLDLILEARKDYKSSSVLACHCHSGVARTGTFIVAFAILNDIDQQIARGVAPKDLKVSVQEMVMKASLQRLFMVGQPTQYLTLYRTIDMYVKSLLLKSKEDLQAMAAACPPMVLQSIPSQPVNEVEQLKGRVQALENMLAKLLAAQPQQAATLASAAEQIKPVIFTGPRDETAGGIPLATVWQAISGEKRKSAANL